MHRFQRSKITFIEVSDSSNSQDDNETSSDTPTLPLPPPRTTSTINDQSSNSYSENKILSKDKNNMNRLSLLPAFPSLHQHGVVVYRGRGQLLLANIPSDRLTEEQRQLRKHNAFKSSFDLIDDRNQDNHIPSFFLSLHEKLMKELAGRLRVDESILDYNYQRLFKCIDIMTNERVQYRIQTNPMDHLEQLPISEYSVALEFYLQIDVESFYMKTCSFRGARPNHSHHQGLFASKTIQVQYGMTQCQQSTCQLCFPSKQILDIRVQQQQSIPVVRFSSAQKHRFVSGYEAILNCPTSCETRNIIYALTCPCNQFDYIGCTSMTLNQRLFYHRQHGNRIMREFILGSKNISQLDNQTKSQEDLTKDGMLLYRHSARCPIAMQWFLDCNPQFWWFVPMLKGEAEQDNEIYKLPSSIPFDPTSPLITTNMIRSDLEAGTCLADLPPLPSNEYTFSNRQCAEQFQILKNKRNILIPNNHLNLYNATIIAVLPNDCSRPLQRIVESLLITHAETKLNTMGHLDRSVQNNNYNPHGMTEDRLIIDRGHWCANLVRSSSFSTLS